MSIRAERRQNHTLQARQENSFEIAEGLALFTDTALILDGLEEMLDSLEDMVQGIAGNGGLSSFGYWTGALYSLLLQEVGADWTGGIRGNTDLAELLRNELNINELRDFNQINLELYGYSEIVATESAWLARVDEIRQGAVDSFAGNPILLLDGAVTYDSHTRDNFFMEVFWFFEQGNLPQMVLYGSFTMTGAWGEIALNEGYTRHQDFGHWVSAADMEIDGNIVRTPTWTLELNEGFEVQNVGINSYRIRRN
ncbi:MAG: hypothetical protein LBE35_09915 [Clostridiales bacterium]|nr:hypothetical protein [Clostridiales bacterium]